MRSRVVIGVVAALVPSIGIVSHAQQVTSAAAAPARPAASASAPNGRFQLLSENQGTVFLVDTATGRVWRYTLVTAPQSVIQDRVDGLITVQEIQNGRPVTDAEKKALSDKLTREQTDIVNAENNPCKGLKTCFVEIDRLRLTPGGGFASEILK